MANLHEVLDRALAIHPNRLENPSRREMIRHVLLHREAIASAGGALATWTPPESTGRSPRDTVLVRRPTSEGEIDWQSPNSNPLAPDTFDMLWTDAVNRLVAKERVYVTHRVIGADPAHALPVRTVTDRALTVLFADNMFRPVPEEIGNSVFADRPFTVLILPYDRIPSHRYRGRLRRLPDGRTSDMVIATDFDRRLGLIYGSAYCGSLKKLLFTVMNYLLPPEGILPLHCSANEADDGSTAVLLGLSGTGKTTLSSDPRRILLGDDEHGWGDDGIANFENGCYAKLIHLSKEKEPEIWEAAFRRADPLEHGAIIENCMFYPEGTFDVDDERLTQNSRVSYPLAHLANVKPHPAGTHPATMLFLTADANGVLPPVARLDHHRAMLWFLMGYTSKLAGTETGVNEPISTFSRFFGEPFMPRLPEEYAHLLGEKLKRHGTRVYLVNTGWSGGPYGQGTRMDIRLTRAVVDAAWSGALEAIPGREDALFHLDVPRSCPGVPDELLVPRSTWDDPAAYDARARRLASEFVEHFEKAYGGKGILPEVAAQCPGR